MQFVKTFSKSFYLLVLFVFMESCFPKLERSIFEPLTIYNLFRSWVLTTTSATPSSFTLGGTISGLTTSELVLSSGGSSPQRLVVAANSSSFQFSNVLATNSTYAVTVSTQPTDLNCTVSNGTGTITANVSNIVVTCTRLVVDTPTFSNASGNYTTPQMISISTTTSGATIYYTTDGTDPTVSSSLYSVLIHIWFLAGRTIKAIAVKSGRTDSAIATAEYSYLPLKVMQTTCFDATSAIACPGLGDDGATQFGVARSYTDNGDGTVTDNATGLLWQRCSVGLSGASCASGTISLLDWPTANTTCNALVTAGKTWRLPTYLELETLTQNPNSIDATAFPATASNAYWTATDFYSNSLNAYIINFADGSSNNSVKTPTTRHVRCVSGPTQTSFSKYVDNGDGTIKDKQTGLTWQKCTFGQNNDATCTGGPGTSVDWVTALATCSSLPLAGKTWRLPNLKEMQSTFDRSRATSPLIDTSFFPSTGNTGYQNSNTYLNNATFSWVINYLDGHQPNSTKAGVTILRCVTGP